MELYTRQLTEYTFVLTEADLKDKRTFRQMQELVKSQNGATPIHHSEPKGSSIKSDIVNCDLCGKPFKRAGLELHKTKSHKRKSHTRKPKVKTPVE